jgi:hypothetical protein
MAGDCAGLDLRPASRGTVEGGGGVHEREPEEEQREIVGHFEGVHVHLGCLDRVDMHNVQVLNGKSPYTNRSTLATVR